MRPGCLLRTVWISVCRFCGLLLGQIIFGMSGAKVSSFWVVPLCSLSCIACLLLQFLSVLNDWWFCTKLWVWASLTSKEKCLAEFFLFLSPLGDSSLQTPLCGERERETERQRQRDRETETDRKTDRERIITAVKMGGRETQRQRIVSGQRDRKRWCVCDVHPNPFCPLPSPPRPSIPKKQRKKSQQQRRVKC